MFKLEGSLLGQALHQVVNDVDLTAYYKSDYFNELISFDNRHLSLEKKNIVHFNKEKRMYFSFQEVTYIKKLEQNLTKKLRQKGQIAKYDFNDIVTASKQMKDIIERSHRIAKTDLTVLITGESGTGKKSWPRPFTTLLIGATSPLLPSMVPPFLIASLKASSSGM